MDSTFLKRPYFRLSLMMFIQFFCWGAWFTTLGLCLSSNDLGGFAGGAYGSAPIAAMCAPLILGFFADRFFQSQKILGVLFLVGGVLMFFVSHFAELGEGKTMVKLITAYMIMFMPTLGLSNTIAFSNLDAESFPKVRVWGTVGWIVAGLTVGLLGWSSSLKIFNLAAGASLVLGLYAFSLPSTPAPAKGQPLNLKAICMLDAFSLFKNTGFLVFMLSSAAICIPLAYYFGLTPQYLERIGFEQPAATMTLGQMSEIVFMLTIPFLFRKLGVKGMILISMLMWAARYACFAYGAEERLIWMIVLGVAIHGICYDFLFVTGFMYADRVAPANLRSQTQSLLVFLTQGVGMYFGYKLAFGKNGAGSLVSDAELNADLGEKGSTESLGFLQQFSHMFTVRMPEESSSALYKQALLEWKSLWELPMILSLCVAVVFALTFRDKNKFKP